MITITIIYLTSMIVSRSSDRRSAIVPRVSLQYLGFDEGLI